MPLDSVDIAALSRLLDEALELSPAEREAWLAALPAADQPHAARLREMLAAQAETGTDGLLSTLPKLGPDEATAHAGERVGPYRLIREIGQGGMGSVWLAERADGAYTRQVALKLPRLAWGAGLAQRMAREREIGMLLEHPNIARLYDAGVDERGRPFLALEFVDGQPIDAWCEAQGLSVRDRLKLFVQVVKAVAYAHGRLVVHRDLKPSNVLVTADGQAHLLDFGIAKLLLEAAPGEPGLTQEQGRVLTPHYASPEQVAGEAITVQSDVYSLGVLLYELLTGTLPIAPKRSTLGALEEAILEGDAPPASSRVEEKSRRRALRGDIDAILTRAMKRNPAHRYASADALGEDIERHLAGDTVRAQPDGFWYRSRKLFARHRVAFIGAGLVLATVVGGSALTLVQSERVRREAERSRVVKDFVIDVFRVNSRDDPGNNELRHLPAELLLERGAQLIDTRFAGQPSLQAELHGVVSHIFTDMGSPKLAELYAAKQVSGLARSGATRLEQATARLLLAQARSKQGRLAEAEADARLALTMSSGDAMATLQARLAMAEILLDAVKYDVLAAEMKDIDRLTADLKVQGPELARATFIKADFLARQGKFDQAQSLYLRAIEIAVASDRQISRLAARMRLRYALELTKHEKLSESKAQVAEALKAMRALGGPDDIEAALKEADAACKMYAGGGHPHRSRGSPHDAGAGAQGSECTDRRGSGDRPGTYRLCDGLVPLVLGRIRAGKPVARESRAGAACKHRQSK